MSETYKMAQPQLIEQEAIELKIRELIRTKTAFDKNWRIEMGGRLGELRSFFPSNKEGTRKYYKRAKEICLEEGVKEWSTRSFQKWVQFAQDREAYERTLEYDAKRREAERAERRDAKASAKVITDAGVAKVITSADVNAEAKRVKEETKRVKEEAKREEEEAASSESTTDCDSPKREPRDVWFMCAKHLKRAVDLFEQADRGDNKELAKEKLSALAKEYGVSVVELRMSTDREKMAQEDRPSMWEVKRVEKILAKIRGVRLNSDEMVKLYALALELKGE